MGSGIKGTEKGWDPGSGITTPGIGISSVFHWIKDQAFLINKILRDKGSKFSSRLEPGIKNLGKITGSAMKKYTSLRPCVVASPLFDHQSSIMIGIEKKKRKKIAPVQICRK